MPARIHLEGRTFNSWKVLNYDKDGYYICECSCGNKSRINGKYLKNGVAKKDCGHSQFTDIINKNINNWIVKRFIGGDNNYYICNCSFCNQEFKVSRSNIMYGRQRNSCKHIKDNSLIGRCIGEWKIIEYYSNNKYKCECSCGNIKIKRLEYLTKNSNCGHKYNLRGNIYGRLKAIRHLGESIWECECQCSNKTIKRVTAGHLISGDTKSCGCITKELHKQTMIKRYNDIAGIRINNARSCEQLELLSDKSKLIDLLKNKEHKITTYELSEILGVTRSRAVQISQDIEIRQYIRLNPQNSVSEDELFKFVRSIYNDDIIRGDRSILGKNELDIYIPEKKLAIEYNGVYWHSEYFKDKQYHQRKTIECAKRGIRLIHIFEHEWNNEITNKKLKDILYNCIQNSSEYSVYARHTRVSTISNEDKDNFCNAYHLQNSSKSEINLGCYYNNELIGVMTFGNPRFNNNYQYELIRLCWKPNFKVIGGTEKMFRYFIENYNPQSIITYVDISKFTGNIYTRLGFKPIQPNPITEPNYVWVEAHSLVTITRYESQKHKLIELGLGSIEQTEDEIMSNLGYLKIYNSGNLKLEWKKGE